ncbi:hypothetical protein M409DRAFT_62610 [Zasmidium cellare ATCC 36951]|uniref:Copper transport protein n=1 Tax=Zasmidium cellare ATCC 36951 TaxID=1080233 RepID=A0A6A6D4A9_ZASCE|nr:uncharacterized protein M409DRAFT_62610 [Zasmidium cellare ATCC 36951]KAF2172969.1 hypothetical protein M409DRAFT_62610 [Zasmidium cellare ATCC 36951]
MDMSGHTDSSSSSTSSGMTSMSMSMVFTTDHSTPLFSSQWTPTTTGAYAGTCIFLIILAIISRLLLAFRSTLERKWHDRAVNRRYVMVAGESERERERQSLPAEEKSAEATLTTNGLDESVRVVRTARNRGMEVVPWRFSTDLPRAGIFFVQAGVGYLLMLAVMTLNVGYFLSVLAGLFVGELAVGRFITADDGHH